MALKPTVTGASSGGRSFAVMAKDIMEGYVALNPLVLKKMDHASYKELHQHLRKTAGGRGVRSFADCAGSERKRRVGSRCLMVAN